MGNKVYLNDVPMDLFLEYYNEFNDNNGKNTPLYINYLTDYALRYSNDSLTYDSPVLLLAEEDSVKDSLNGLCGDLVDTIPEKVKLNSKKEVFNMVVVATDSMKLIYSKLLHRDYVIGKNGYINVNMPSKYMITHMVKSFYKYVKYTMPYGDIAPDDFLSDSINPYKTLDLTGYDYDTKLKVYIKITDSKVYIVTEGTPYQSPKVLDGKVLYADKYGLETTVESEIGNFQKHQNAMRTALDSVESSLEWENKIQPEQLCIIDNGLNSNVAYYDKYNVVETYEPVNFENLDLRDEDIRNAIINAKPLEDKNIAAEVLSGENVRKEASVINKVYLDDLKSYTTYDAYITGLVNGGTTPAYLIPDFRDTDSPYCYLNPYHAYIISPSGSLYNIEGNNFTIQNISLTSTSPDGLYFTRYYADNKNVPLYGLSTDSPYILLEIIDYLMMKYLTKQIEKGKFSSDIDAMNNLKQTLTIYFSDDDSIKISIFNKNGKRYAQIASKEIKLEENYNEKNGDYLSIRSDGTYDKSGYERYFIKIPLGIKKTKAALKRVFCKVNKIDSGEDADNIHSGSMEGLYYATPYDKYKDYQIPNDGPVRTEEYYTNPHNLLSYIKKSTVKTKILPESPLVDIFDGPIYDYDKFITSVMNKGYYFKDSGGLLRGDLISDTELLDKKKKAANSVILDIMNLPSPSANIDLQAQYRKSDGYIRIYDLCKGYHNIIKYILANRKLESGRLKGNNQIDPDSIAYRLVLEESPYAITKGALSSIVDSSLDNISVTDERTLEQRLIESEKYPMSYLYEKAMTDKKKRQLEESVLEGTRDSYTNTLIYSGLTLSDIQATIKRNNSSMSKLKNIMASALANAYFTGNEKYLKREDLNFSKVASVESNMTYNSPGSRSKYKKVYGANSFASKKKNKDGDCIEDLDNLLKDLLVPTENNTIFNVSMIK